MARQHLRFKHRFQSTGVSSSRATTASGSQTQAHDDKAFPAVFIICSVFNDFGMSNLKEVFEKAAEHVKTLSSVSQEDQKYLYGRYKQAKVGDCNTGRPGLLSPKERAKWDAWNSIKGLSAEDAMRQYVTKVDALTGSSFSSELR
jgi:diazepam-binding inhibitor (GABA receptor modulating acyl-CoA-binding protein)